MEKKRRGPTVIGRWSHKQQVGEVDKGGKHETKKSQERERERGGR